MSFFRPPFSPVQPPNSIIDWTNATQNFSTSGKGTVGGTVDVVQWTVKGSATQTFDLAQYKNSAGTVLASIGADGSLSINGTGTYNVINGSLVVDVNTLFVDSENDRVGIGTDTPEETLDVVGNIGVTGTVDGVHVSDTGEPLHGLFDTVEDIITINTDPSKFDVAAFDYYINGVKYSYAGATAVDPAFTAGDNFVLVGVNSSGLFFNEKDTFFTPTELLTALEVGGVATIDGTVLAAVGNSHYDADSSMRNSHLRTKFAEGTAFLGAAGSVSENSLTPLTLDIASGEIFDPNDNLEFITAESGVGMVGNWHVSGDYTLVTPSTPFTIDDGVYDNGTDLVALSNNKFATHTVMRSSRTGTYYFTYGLTEHASLGDAVDAPAHLGIFEGQVGNEVEPLAKVIVKEGAGIQQIVDVRGLTSSVVSASTSTLQTTYDRSATPEIVTDSTRGAFSVRGGTGTDTDKNISVENNSGIETAFIRANGDLSSTGASAGITTVTSDTLLDGTFHTVLADAVAGDVTITLPAAAANTGRLYVVKKKDSTSNDVIIDGNASETIDGQLTISLNLQYASITLQCDGTSWFII